MNGHPSSPEEIKGYCWTFLNAFEDLTLEVERVVADGDWVAARVIARGTHTAALDTLQATGRTVEITQHDLVRVVGGRVVECWTVFDQYSMLQQLGALPAAA